MIISGSVRRFGQRLRVTAQLIDGATGCYIWSESVDAVVGDLFPVRSASRRPLPAASSPNWAAADPAAQRRESRTRTWPHTTFTCRAATI